MPSDQESQDFFGVPLYKRKIQPVWLEISNNSDATITFLPLGLDPQYFTPIESAFIRAGWDETEVASVSSLAKMGKSFVSGSEYRYSPVSGLYVFGRPQDVAFQKARANINERNHLRLWMSPLRFDGVPVWIGQISRDIGVRLTTKTITTHKVDPDVDETREYLVENLAYSQALAKLGYVGGVGPATIAARCATGCRKAAGGVGFRYRIAR